MTTCGEPRLVAQPSADVTAHLRGLMSPCERCAAMGPTCCERTEVLVTLGDIRRIERFAQRDGFWIRKSPPDSSFLDQGADPNFARWAFDDQGQRRVLRRRPNGACMFLSQRGCTLPGNVRPLVCRLYPYDYSEYGIAGVASHCPSELVPPGATLLHILDMKRMEAQQWHKTLYHELRTEWEQHAHRDDV